MAYSDNKSLYILTINGEEYVSSEPIKMRTNIHDNGYIFILKGINKIVKCDFGDNIYIN